jgi:phosphate uptake regulator
MVKNLTNATRRKLATAKRRREKPARIDEQEERIFREAIKYLLFNHGHLLVPTDMREISVKGFPVWILTITLRYPTGFEGYVGDLLYDGEKFTFLTEQSVMDERVRRIAADPERERKWNEYRASALQAGER